MQALNRPMFAKKRPKKDSYSYYDVLGIKQDADDNAVREAYRVQARKWHPDRAGDKNKKASEQRFQLVNQAYISLQTEPQRKAYNKFLKQEQMQKQQAARERKKKHPLYIALENIREIVWPIAPR